MIIPVYWTELELHKAGEWCVYTCISAVGLS